MGEFILNGVKYILGLVVENGEQIFTLVAMVGVFVSMFGGKKLGTKLTGGSILSYIIVKVISGR